MIISFARIITINVGPISPQYTSVITYDTLRRMPSAYPEPQPEDTIEPHQSMPNGTFTIHEGILTLSSKFFAAALRHDWRERTTSTIHLHTANPRHFVIYMKWLYTSQLFIKFPDDGKEGNYRTEEYPRWDALCKLGDFLQDDGFKDCLVDAALERIKHTSSVPYHIHKTIYNNSAKDSAHRMFVVDLYMSIGDMEKLGAFTKEEECGEFVGDLMLSCASALLEGRAHDKNLRIGAKADISGMSILGGRRSVIGRREAFFTG
jgi:hypothetical protein